MLDVFAAHSIAPTQISRLLPGKFTIPMQDFATAATLKSHLTPALLDWLADYFALNRPWLDGVGGRPHQPLLCYKHPGDFAHWLAERRNGEPFQFRLLVFKPSRRPIHPDSDEDVVIALEELIAYLDDQPICRYYLCDGSGPLDHYPVIRSLFGMFAVADKARCQVRGKVLSPKDCEAMASGRLVIPQGLKKSRQFWEPDTLLFTAPTVDQPWQQQLRADLVADLDGTP